MDLSTLIKQFYAVDTLEGYTEEEINKLKVMYGALPAALEEFYRTAGRAYLILLFSIRIFHNDLTANFYLFFRNSYQ